MIAAGEIPMLVVVRDGRGQIAIRAAEGVPPSVLLGALGQYIEELRVAVVVDRLQGPSRIELAPATALKKH